MKRCSHCLNSAPTEATQSHAKPLEATARTPEATKSQQMPIDETTRQQEPSKTKAAAAFNRLNKKLDGGINQ
ncbi:hypothetical protein LC613_10440 [Nostoc sphaeroides CHAB 2801]|uniref:hypothetical protein n=1 Tax=Nostoc sphaeroides TaxID=446679 RepID=UPI000E4A32EB|nr:hypothetical protein [Nostoc sphaeroides]MCC5628498.1 hypothetical protein [Nostoc sphaeroides CHAB 2801]